MPVKRELTANRVPFPPMDMAGSFEILRELLGGRE
jgi:hypothetical protein